MISTTVTLPELGLIAGTRAALGLGIGLLIAERIAPRRRHALGWTLLAVGVVSTVPLLADVLARQKASIGPPSQPSLRPDRAGRVPGLVEAAPS